MSKHTTLTTPAAPRDPVGTVKQSEVLGKKFPCVKVADDMWIIANGLKWLRDFGQANGKIGDHILISECGK